MIGVDVNQGGSLVDGIQRHNQNTIHQDTICQPHLDGMVQLCMNAKVDSTAEEKNAFRLKYSRQGIHADVLVEAPAKNGRWASDI